MLVAQRVIADREDLLNDAVHKADTVGVDLAVSVINPVPQGGVRQREVRAHGSRYVRILSEQLDEDRALRLIQAGVKNVFNVLAVLRRGENFIGGVEGRGRTHATHGTFFLWQHDRCQLFDHQLQRVPGVILHQRIPG